jgi:hypothetical protein
MVGDKWLALCALSCVVIAALLPFFLLRYYLGGVEVVNELIMLLWTWIGSLVMAAAAILVATAPPSGRVIGCCVMLLALPVVQAPAMAMWPGNGSPSAAGVLLSIWLLSSVVFVTLALGGAAMRLAGESLDALTMTHDRAVFG